MPTKMPTIMPTASPSTAPGVYEIVVTVNPSAVDAAVDLNACNPPTYTSNNCNFRSAWTYCVNLDNWVTTSIYSCVIEVSTDISLISSNGELESISTSFSVSAAGDDTVSIMVKGTNNEQTIITSSNELTFVSFSTESSQSNSRMFNLSYHNLIFDGFGKSSLFYGGYISRVDYLLMDTVTIKNGKGVTGGTVKLYY